MTFGARVANAAMYVWVARPPRCPRRRLARGAGWEHDENTAAPRARRRARVEVQGRGGHFSNPSGARRATIGRVQLRPLGSTLAFAMVFRPRVTPCGQAPLRPTLLRAEVISRALSRRAACQNTVLLANREV